MVRRFQGGSYSQGEHVYGRLVGGSPLRTRYVAALRHAPRVHMDHATIHRLRGSLEFPARKGVSSPHAAGVVGWRLDATSLNIGTRHPSSSLRIADGSRRPNVA